MPHILLIVLYHTVHVRQFLLYHIQSRTSRITNGRIRQTSMVVYVQNVMHVVTLMQKVRLKACQARIARIHLVVLQLLVSYFQLKTSRWRPLRYGTSAGRIQAAYAYITT